MKKLLLGIILCLLLVTGCGKKTTNSENNEKKNDEVAVVTINGKEFKLRSDASLKDMHYKENYVDFHTDAYGDMRTMDYSLKGEFYFQVRIAYDAENRMDSISYYVPPEKEIKEINGIKYDYYEYTNDNNNPIHLYVCKYNDATYGIMFIYKNMGNLEEVFMNNVSFE